MFDHEHSNHVVSMKLHITPHHLTLSEALNGFTARKLSALGGITPDIDAAHVVLRLDPKTNPERRFSASVRLVVRGADVFARGTGQDLYTTIDQVVDKLTNGLRARKSRLHSWHRRPDASPLRNFAAA